MGSSEDQNKRVDYGYESAAAEAAQAFLASSSCGVEEEEEEEEEEEREGNQQYDEISYNSGGRSLKDVAFLILFLVFLVSTFALGMFAIIHRNTEYSSFVYDPTTSSCVSVKPSSHLRFPFSSLNVLVWTLVITFLLSIPFCWALLLLLNHYTKQIVYAAIPLFIAIPIFLNVYWFVACSLAPTCSRSFPLAYRILVFLFLFLLIAVFLWILVVNWHRLHLTVTVISVASRALSLNLPLLALPPSFTLALLLLYAPIVLFMLFARFNGNIVLKNLHPGYACVWKEDSWVPAYFALAILTMLWSFTAMVEAQVYVISSTIANWYFSKDHPKRPIRTSLRNAFGPSSGTICLSGLLVCVVRLVRSAVDSARQEDTPGIVNLVLRCFVNALLTPVDFLNKFTINFAAITGEAYCSSARMTYELLRRNLLSAVFVETISSRILAGIVFVFSAIYTIVACVILKAGTNLGADSYFVAAMAWVLLIIVLGYLVHVLDNVIDTIYVCYAIDRDRGEVCKQDVHEVYVQLPISRSLRQSVTSRALGV